MSLSENERYNNAQRIRELKRLIEKHPRTGRMTPSKQFAILLDLYNRKPTRGASIVVLQRSPLIVTPEVKKTRRVTVTWQDGKTTADRKPLSDTGSPNKVRMTTDAALQTPAPPLTILYRFELAIRSSSMSKYTTRRSTRTAGTSRLQRRFTGVSYRRRLNKLKDKCRRYDKRSCASESCARPTST